MYKDFKITKQYYTISELAKELKIHTSQLRFYEQVGVIKASGRTRRGERKYKKENADRIRLVIRCARSKYYTLNGLRYIYSTGELSSVFQTNI